MQTVRLATEDDTRALGARLATRLQRNDVLALWGDLGAGKTTLVRGLIQSLLGTGEEVPSPTYTLVQAYDVAELTFWHFDLYRLEAPGDVHELGWDEAAEGVCLIEWPQRAGAFLPANRLDVVLENSGEGRLARLEPQGEGWQNRLDDFID